MRFDSKSRSEILLCIESKLIDIYSSIFLLQNSISFLNIGATSKLATLTPLGQILRCNSCNSRFCGPAVLLGRISRGRVRRIFGGGRLALLAAKNLTERSQ